MIADETGVIAFLRGISHVYNNINDFVSTGDTAVLHRANCSINIKSALVHIMAWHQTGNKPLYEPMIAEPIMA